MGWVSCSLFPHLKPIPTHEKIFAVGKKWPKCHFKPTFSWVGVALGWVGLGLGWPWVGEFVGLIIMSIYVFNAT